MKKNIRKNAVFIIGCVLLSSQIAGCATTSPSAERGGMIGAGSGAVMGAIVGQIIAGDTKGTLIGAAIGALAGGIVGSYIDQQNATRAQAAQKYQYNGKESKIEIEKASILPVHVTPGAALESRVQYTLLSPKVDQQIAITEHRAVVGSKESFDLSERKITREQGTHTSTMKINLPKDLPKGNYTLVTTITDGRDTKSAKTSFLVS